ncbi:hypothetical protein SAMN05216371_2260 [Streptomyces sp. TLI_053]|uniref:DUF6879 family protein n=1 Tax=Streptomyces sp. TLI_053 TaxID=1855352 RepID=UPI00087AEB89|nr:DUF6879 family protein [Streptomyces sp. TLI_053]SDT42804.1 hypothetical protein SAMN05216371_2260 [Streptomyces sp. TLI_053]
MRDLLADVPGDRLLLDEYRKDFRQRDFAVDGYDSWKLERRQDFQEPDDDSWRAYSAGDRGRALELLEGRRGELLQLSRLAAYHACRLLRVRVVEFPLTPYLAWELQFLRLRAECGELIRVVGPEAVASYEQDGPLPELVTLGPDTVYDISYDASGLLDGATRHLDTAVRDSVAGFIAHLYDQGEDIGAFMAREVDQIPVEH